MASLSDQHGYVVFLVFLEVAKDSGWRNIAFCL